jgi:Ca2+-binding RTX toxin-like protein
MTLLSPLDANNAAFRPITVNVNANFMNVISTRFWYLPAWSSLRYNNQNLDSTTGPNQPSFDLTQSAPEGSANVFFIGGPGNDKASGNLHNVFLGGAGQDDLGQRSDPVSFNLSLLWGGAGADLFHIYWNRGGVIINNVMDLKAEDRLFVHFGASNPMTNAMFREAVNEVSFLFSETRNFIFEVTANQTSFVGSAFSDVISVGSTPTIVTSIDGGLGNDSIYGSTRRETLNGGGGNDVIDGGGGRDDIIASAGADTVSFYQGDRLLAFNPSDLLDDTIIIKTLDTTVTGQFARVIYDLQSDRAGTQLNGGQFDDSLSGSAARQTLSGGAGNDTLQAFGDRSLLLGGAGNDLLIGFGNQVTLTGGAGIDVFRLYQADFTITDLQRGETIMVYRYSTAFEAALNRLTASGANIVYAVNGVFEQSDLSMVGRQGNDTFQGSSFNDSLRGEGGNDSLSGGSGNDTLFGGDGLDTLRGGNGADSLWGGAANDWLEGGAGDDVLGGDGGNDTVLGGFGNDVLNGGADNDVLMGLDGNDTLNGGLGNDILNGGIGENVLTGGGGNDIFVFGPTNQSLVNTITDFTTNSDKIDLSAFTLAGFSIATIRNAVQFNSATRTLSADINQDRILDLNVRLNTSSFNLRNDVIINVLA